MYGQIDTIESHRSVVRSFVRSFIRSLTDSPVPQLWKKLQVRKRETCGARKPSITKISVSGRVQPKKEGISLVTLKGTKNVDRPERVANIL